MKILITESQYNLLLEQKTLSSIINDVRILSNLITLIRVIARGVNSSDLERVQSLVKQYLAGGKVDLTDEELDKIRQAQKTILNTVSNNMGYTDWNQLKNKIMK